MTKEAKEKKPTKTAKAEAEQDAPQTAMEQLTPRDQVFVREYLKHLQPVKAALAAGYSGTVARSKAFQWVANPEVKPLVYAAVQEEMNKRAIRTQITADKVLERYWNIATADPNELTQVRHLNCRHCHGINHEFQWKDEAEYEDALASVIAEEKAIQQDDPGYRADYPTDAGGYGYGPLNDPHPDCPKCYGEGKVDLYLGDTRCLSPQGQALFAGVKQTKTGIEVMMHDQKAALDQVARHLGMFNDKLTLANDKENPLQMFLAQLPGNTLKPVEQEDK